ncbi:hypothetical protein SAMN05444274_104126 [Mariniphaga anaerophila]|uniref:Uncharacterized protein n=1 Tax=Mariniphaga anaerophila TaxID=1484053 RepID=A0A1M4ZZY2_9BACT|nr:hypothetical protein SAMN05444274_104126 [Mariniphaga anaerophila]
MVLNDDFLLESCPVFLINCLVKEIIVNFIARNPVEFGQ